MAKIEATRIGRWTVGFLKTSGDAVLAFSFTDRPDMTFVIPAAEAPKIARALLDEAERPEPGQRH